ncbi:MAG: TlpA disulfide reductase family protein [Dehalococcoidia bacterium]|nr:TlpA disulfide reductase family protein [Dehalococcoidia bacterium]
MKLRRSRSKDTERTPEWRDQDEPAGSRSRLFLVPAVVLVIVFALVYLLQAGETDAVGATTQVYGGKATGTGPKVGAPAADFTLANLDGKPTALSSFKGKVVMLNFFATWCPPCRAEMPDLVATYRDSKDKGFEIVAVDLQEDKATVAGYAKSLGIEFTVLLDSNATVFGQYHVNGLPTSIFIDRNGTIQEIVIGGLNKNLINQKLDKLLQP